MKLNAHNYEAKEIFKIIREWTGLTQEELSNELNHKGRSWAKGIESGHNRYYFDDLLNNPLILLNPFCAFDTILSMFILYTKNN